MSSRRIPDPGSLIAGITFAGVGLIFLIGDANLADRARWVWPIVLVGLGAGLLAAVLRGTVERDEAADASAVEPAPAGDTTAHQPVGDSAVEGTAVEERRAEDEPAG